MARGGVSHCLGARRGTLRARWSRGHSRRADPHFRSDKPLFNKLMDAEEATEMINDPNWTKFVFLRDPAERLKSAYLDKFANGKR